MDRRNHVRTLEMARVNVVQVDESLITLRNLVSGTSRDRLNSGSCMKSVEDLKRYGRGGWRLMVYATTLLLTIKSNAQCQERTIENT